MRPNNSKRPVPLRLSVNALSVANNDLKTLATLDEFNRHVRVRGMVAA